MSFPFFAVAFTLCFASSAFAQITEGPQLYQQSNLIADTTATATASAIDPHLKGPRGFSVPSGGGFWVADAGSALSTVYYAPSNVDLLTVITIPGTPTGIVSNAFINDFVINRRAASFIYATLEGCIAAWNASGQSSTANTIVCAPGANFTGLALARATVGGVTSRYLYAADFKGGKVDVFDSRFQRVPTIENAIAVLGVPTGFAPFGIQNIGGNLYVTLAPVDGTTGSGQGGVAVISPEGKLIGLLNGGDHLNAPWGVALAPGHFGLYSHDLLVANHGDGTISVFNPQTGAYIATLLAGVNTPLVIQGLWGLSFGNDSSNGGLATSLYFTAAPGTGGLFGSLNPFEDYDGGNN